MELPVSINLHAYWNAIRAGRGAPDRNDIVPGSIRGILANTFVLDFDDEDEFPFRIVGWRANALFLTELRGLPFLQLWREADRQEVRSILHCVAGDTQPFCLGAEARPPGLDRLDIEAMLLPLRHHGSTRSRVLGSLACGSTSHWLGLVGAGPMTLICRRALDHELASAPDPAATSFRRPCIDPSRDSRRPLRRKRGSLKPGAGGPATNGVEPVLSFRPGPFRIGAVAPPEQAAREAHSHRTGECAEMMSPELLI